MPHTGNEIKSLEKEVEALRSENAGLKKDFDQFTYIVSHDLNAPLRGISNLVTWITSDLGDSLPEQIKEYVSLLQERVEKMKRMLDGMLEISRVSRKNLDIRHFDPDKVIPALCKKLQPENGPKISCKGNCPGFETYAIKLEEALSHIIENSIRFHESEIGTISITWKQEDAFLVLTITDDGPGFSPEMSEKVVLPFFSLHPEKNTAGIGLSLVQKIISFAGGSMSIYSEKKMGTEVCVKWPMNVNPQYTISPLPQSGLQKNEK